MDGGCAAGPYRSDCPHLSHLQELDLPWVTQQQNCSARNCARRCAGKGEVEVLLMHDATAAAAAPPPLPPAQGQTFPVYPYPVRIAGCYIG